MLSKGMNVDAAPSPLPPMTPPLIEAVCTGQCELVELLLDQHASLKARDVAYGEPKHHSPTPIDPRSSATFHGHTGWSSLPVRI